MFEDREPGVAQRPLSPTKGKLRAEGSEHLAFPVWPPLPSTQVESNFWWVPSTSILRSKENFTLPLRPECSFSSKLIYLGHFGGCRVGDLSSLYGSTRLKKTIGNCQLTGWKVSFHVFLSPQLLGPESGLNSFSLPIWKERLRLGPWGCLLSQGGSEDVHWRNNHMIKLMKGWWCFHICGNEILSKTNSIIPFKIYLPAGPKRETKGGPGWL